MIRISLQSFGSSENLCNENSPGEAGGNFGRNSGNGGCKNPLYYSDIVIGFRIEIRHSNRLPELGLKMARPGMLWNILQE